VKTYAFKEVDPDEINFDNLDSRGEVFKGIKDRSAESYEVYFLTEADCDDIRVTLGGDESYPFYCGYTVWWKTVPPGTYSVVVKGCGGEVIADLEIDKDLYLTICPADLGLSDCCPEGTLEDGSYVCDDECPGGSAGTTTVSNATTTTVDGESTTTTSVCPSEQIYGEHSAEIEFLRNFRDTVLSKTPEGQEIIKLYYQWSPAIAKTMETDEIFKKEIKKAIDEVLKMIR